MLFYGLKLMKNGSLMSIPIQLRNNNYMMKFLYLILIIAIGIYLYSVSIPNSEVERKKNIQKVDNKREEVHVKTPLPLDKIEIDSKNIIELDKEVKPIDIKDKMKEVGTDDEDNEEGIALDHQIEMEDVGMEDEDNEEGVALDHQIEMEDVGMEDGDNEEGIALDHQIKIKKD